MGQEQESAATEVERLTKLRDEAEKGIAEHRELNHRLMKARGGCTASSGVSGIDAADPHLRPRPTVEASRHPCETAAGTDGLRTECI
jgi:hypothetical protein